jgi:hypothetical protein
MSAAALYPTDASDITGPAIGGFAITPDNDTDLPKVVRAIFVGTPGNITVVFARGGGPVTFYNVQGRLEVMASRVMATGTTASNLTGVY